MEKTALRGTTLTELCTNIFWAIKSRKMRWARYVAHMGRKTDA
jgi:hypothetical protein